MLCDCSILQAVDFDKMECCTNVSSRFCAICLLLAVDALCYNADTGKEAFYMAIKSDAQRRAVAKYNSNNYEQIQIRVPKGEKDKIKAHAEKLDGGSVNAFINRAIEEQIRRDNENL